MAGLTRNGVKIERGAAEAGRLPGAVAAASPRCGWPLGAALLAAVTVASPAAASGGLVVGPGMTFGDGPYSGSVHTLSENPAGHALAPRGHVQFGFSGGFGYEIGDVSDLFDRIDELSDALDKEELTLQEGEELIDDLEGVLVDLGRDGRAKFAGHARLPISIRRPSQGYALGLEFDGHFHGGVSVLDDTLRYIPETEQLQSRTSVYLKGGLTSRMALVPSMHLGEWQGGEWYAGARLSYHQAELYKSVIALEETDRDMGDIIDDELDRQQRESTAFGVDLGMVYRTDRYRAGLTLLNLNEPAFDFPTVGLNCAGIADVDLQTNCYTAASFGDRIDLEETWTLNRQARLEGAVNDRHQRYVLTAGYDTNSVSDLSGDEYQWLTFGGLLLFSNYTRLLPDLRLGYRKNLTGSELTYYSFGIDWLRIFSFDVAFTPESVEFEEDSLPRSAMASLGLQLRF